MTDGAADADPDDVWEIGWDDEDTPEGATADGGGAEVPGLESESNAWILPEIEDEHPLTTQLAANPPPEPDGPPKKVATSTDEIDFSDVDLEFVEEEMKELLADGAAEAEDDLGPPLPDPSMPAEADDNSPAPEPVYEDADPAAIDLSDDVGPAVEEIEDDPEDDPEDDLGPPLPDLSPPADPVHRDAEASASDESEAGEDLGPPLPDLSAPDIAADGGAPDGPLAADEVARLLGDAPTQSTDTAAPIPEESTDTPEEASEEPAGDPAADDQPPPEPPAPAEGEAASPTPAQMLATALEMHRGGDLPGAAAAYEALARRDPGSSACWINLGVVLRRLGRLQAAIICLRRGVSLNPKDGAAWSNLGNALRAGNMLEDAKQAQIQAISLNPGAPQIHYNLGLVLRDFGDLDEAAHAFHRAELLGYKNPDLQWDQSLNMMLGGDLKGGFETHDSRFNLAEAVERFAEVPRWTGEPAGGRTLLVHAEQGLGDSLQFCRYVPLLKERAGHVIFDVQPPLVRLLEANPAFDGVELHPRDGTMPEADLQIPLLSVPRLFPVDEEDLPGRTAYLSPPDGGPRIAGAAGRKRVGIAWAGKPTHKNDHNRSIGLTGFAPLLDHPGLRFFSLQVGPEAQQIHDLSLGALVEDLGPHIRDFADTASLLRDLDIVVTVDTSVAHLAAAMGKPVWILLPFAPDWRWQLRRADSPWYPSIRLFRQTSPGDWDDVFMRIRSELGKWVRNG